MAKIQICIAQIRILKLNGLLKQIVMTMDLTCTLALLRMETIFMQIHGIILELK